MIFECLLVFGVIYAAVALMYQITKFGPVRDFEGVDLTGKVIIITGASAGLGFETARGLASHKPTIIFACRNQKKN